MRLNFYLFTLLINLFLLGNNRTASGANINVTTATIISSLGSAADGDVLLLAPGSYTSAFGIQNNKTLTIKSDGTGTVILNFAFAASANNTGGGLIFDGVTIDRAGGDFLSAAIGTVGTLAFRNCTIENLGRYIVRTTDATAKTMTNYEISNCIIRNCGTALSWALNRLAHHVQNVTIRNNTFYNYQGEDIFLSAAPAQNTEFDTDFRFENNTVYKCINATKGGAYAICNAANKFKTTSTFTFRNNIFNLNGVSGSNKSPYILTGATAAKTLIAEKNLIVDFIGANSTPYNYTTITNVTKDDVTLEGLGISTIGFADPGTGDLSIPSTSAIATASTTGGILGDPRWLKVVTSAVSLTTSASPEAGGKVSPESGTYNKADNVTLTASRNFGYKFKEWQNASTGAVLSTSNPFTFAINEGISVKAVFEPLTTYNFTVVTQGSQWGNIRLNPTATNGKYEEGTVVSVTALTNPIVNFLNWEDQTTNLTRNIVVDSDKTLNATFDEIPFIVGWDFKVPTPNPDKPADYYSVLSNSGLFTMKNADGTSVGWLASSSAFSPAYPCIRMWTPSASFASPRSFVATFSTAGYKNIKINSMVASSWYAYSIITLQYSLDGTNYVELDRVDMTAAYNASWKDLKVTLPAAAEGQSKVYIRWIEDVSSATLGNAGDVDGTSITNVFVYADKEAVNDGAAPVLVSTVPAHNSSTASATGSIVLTFDEKVKAGTGSITLGSKVITGSYGSKTATFAYEKLSYDTEYTFTVPAGALTDMSGNVFEGVVVKFKTSKRSEPVKKLFDAVVATDGSGDYTSVIAAIAAAPANRVQPWLIYVKNGTYKGHHEIPANKPFIHLIGQSRDGVIITDNIGTNTNSSWEQGSTMYVAGNNCYFENILFQNEFGYFGKQGPPALAFYTKGDRFAMKNTYLRSFQDTYFTGNVSNNRVYIVGSRIEGAVDYIYGNGNVFFDRDTLTNARKGSVIVAPSHNSETTYGYVFRDCIINEDPALVEKGEHRFGRPWQGTPKAVFINTKALAGIHPQGWADMGVLPAIFADYGTVDKSGNLLDVSQRKSSYSANGVTLGSTKNFLTDAEAATYTYENVILRNGDDWDPRLMAEAPESPTNVTANELSVNWEPVSYARLYIVFRNDAALAFTTSTSYTDITAVSGQAYIYAVQAVGEFGALSAATVAGGAVVKKAQTITFNALPAKIDTDADFDAGAIASSGLAVTLSSSNTNVATIVEGKIHIIGAGTTTITATQPGDASWLAATAVSNELVVTSAVVKQAQAITFNALPAKTVGDVAFDAGAIATSGLAVTLSSSNTNVATIVDGKIHIIGAGTTTITATQAGDASWNAATSVSRELVVSVLQQAQTITFNILPAKTVGDGDFEAGAITTSGLAVTLSSSNTAVATIVGTKIHLVGAGTTSITASQAGSANWAAATPVSRELVVSKVAQTITFNSLPAKSITSDDFAAGGTASSGLAVSYTSSNTAVAIVVNGTIQITGVGSTDITATQAGNTQYAAATAVLRALVITDRFKLPADNFQVKASDEVCSTGNDGKITITATQNLGYKASLTINGTNTVLPFTTNLEIPALNSGSYKVCITVVGQADYSQCFDVTVREPQALSMYSVVQSADKTVVLNLAGSNRYFITMNDKSYQTTTSSITLALAEGQNQISVSTEKDCQGTIEKSIFISNGLSIYPNPFDQHVFINMGNDSSSSAKVSLTDLSGARKYSANQQVQNGVVQVNFSDLPQGMYIINVKTSLTESSSKILKQ